MEIEKCSCGHNAINYYKVDRHIYLMPDRRQVYSNKCMEQNCNCERARIMPNVVPELDIEKEKAKWGKILARAIG